MVNIIETLKSLNLGSIVSNTNRTLKTIKKAIPVYKEVRPYLKGDKKLFKKEDIIKNESIEKEEIDYNDNLTFFH